LNNSSAPLMPEEMKKQSGKIPRDRDVVELFKS
jgi:hypothetical protein